MGGAIKKATRPFFAASRKSDQIFYEGDLEFEWHSGISWQVRQRSSDSLADAIIDKYSEKGIRRQDILEVSTASRDYETGQALSAINLVYKDEDTGSLCSVENWFQASKVFGKSGKVFGPYLELLHVKTPKRYLNTSLPADIAVQYKDDWTFQKIQGEIRQAPLVRFELSGRRYPLIPRSCFYDYLYVKALRQEQNRMLAERIADYKVFTDIMFTPGAGQQQKYNTQARSSAIFVSLHSKGLIDTAIVDIDSFVDIVGYQSAVQIEFPC